MARVNKTALLILPEPIHLCESAVSRSQLALLRVTVVPQLCSMSRPPSG